MDLDDEELIATRDDGKCEYCNLGLGEERDIGQLKNEEFVIERHYSGYLLNGFADEVKIKYCPMCGRKLK